MSAVCAAIPANLAGHVSQNFSRLDRNISPTVTTIAGLILMPYVWYALLRMEWTSSPVLKAIRKSHAACGANCPNGTVCSAELLRDATSLRDNMRTTASVLKRYGILSAAHARALRIEDDWSSLVEDLTLAADPEFRSMAAELAKHI